MLTLNLIKDSEGKDLGDGNLENFAYLWKNPSYVTDDLPWEPETSYESSRDISAALDCSARARKTVGTQGSGDCSSHEINRNQTNPDCRDRLI